MNETPQLVRLSDSATFDLGSQTTVGRRDDCNIVLDESGVSRLHAQFTITESEVSLEDFSRNGTRVNGDVINATIHLQHDDIIQFDKEEFRLVAPNITPPVTTNHDPVVKSDYKPTRVDALNDNDTNNSVYAEDSFQRKPLPERPNVGTVVVFSGESGNYEKLNVKDYKKPALVIRNGKTPGRVFDLHDSYDSWSVGSAECDIRITDEGVSSQHAMIKRVDNTWEIVDQMATNVLRVNSTATNRCYLRSGDLISFGSIDCEFILPQGYRSRKSPSSSKKPKVMLWALISLALIAGVAFYLLKEDYLTNFLEQLEE